MVLARDVEEQVGGLLVVAVVLDDECLEHLRSSGLEVLHRKALQNLRTYIRKLRLTDHPEHVLIAAHIDAGLASD